MPWRPIVTSDDAVKAKIDRLSLADLQTVCGDGTFLSDALIDYGVRRAGAGDVVNQVLWVPPSVVMQLAPEDAAWRSSFAGSLSPAPGYLDTPEFQLHGNAAVALLPINDGAGVAADSGSHWSLLAFYKGAAPADCRFVHYDSADGMHGALAARVVAAMVHAGLLSQGFPVVRSGHIRRQTDGYNCGAYVIQLARLIRDAGQEPPPATLGAVTSATCGQLRDELRNALKADALVTDEAPPAAPHGPAVQLSYAAASAPAPAGSGLLGAMMPVLIGRGAVDAHRALAAAHAVLQQVHQLPAGLNTPELEAKVSSLRSRLANLLEHVVEPMASLAHQKKLPQWTQQYIEEELGKPQQADITLAVMDVLSIWGDIRILLSKDASFKERLDAGLDAAVALADALTLTTGLVGDRIRPPTIPESEAGEASGDAADGEAEAPEPVQDATVTKLVDALGLLTAGLSSVLLVYRFYRKLEAVASGRYGPATGGVETVEFLIADSAQAVALVNSCFTTLKATLTLINDFAGSEQLGASLAMSASVTPILNIIAGSLTGMCSAYKGLKWFGFNACLRKQRAELRYFLRQHKQDGEPWERGDPVRLSRALAASKHVSHILRKRELQAAWDFTLSTVMVTSTALYLSGYGVPISFGMQLSAAAAGIAVKGGLELRDMSRELEAGAYIELTRKKWGQRRITPSEMRELAVLVDELGKWPVDRVGDQAPDDVPPWLHRPDSYPYGDYDAVLAVHFRPTARQKRRELLTQTYLNRELPLDAQIELHALEESTPGYWQDLWTKHLSVPWGDANRKHRRTQQLFDRLEGRYSLSESWRRGAKRLDALEREKDFRARSHARYTSASANSRLTPWGSADDLTPEQQELLADHDRGRISFLHGVFLVLKPNWTRAAALQRARHLKHALAIVNLNPASAHEGAMRSALIGALTSGSPAKFAGQAAAASKADDSALIQQLINTLYGRNKAAIRDVQEALHTAGLSDAVYQSYVKLLAQEPHALLQLLAEPIGAQAGDDQDAHRRSLIQALRISGQRMMLAGYLVKLMEAS